MASKLDQAIASVAIQAGTYDVTKLIAAAAEVAATLTPADIAKLPERWYPAVTSKAAGAPELRDSWPLLWFEALTEVLCQTRKAGLSALFTLLDRGGSYSHLIVIRLLRIAAAGSERDAILAKLDDTLPLLHQTQVYDSVREVVGWSEREPQPLELLRQFEALTVKNTETHTVGSYIEQFESELALAKARRAPRKSADPLSEEIVCLAVLGLEADHFRERSVAAARSLGPAAIDRLVASLNKPDLAALESRVPPTIPNHQAIWCRAIFEILGHLGAGAVPAAQSLVTDDDEYIRELSIRLLCRLAASQNGAERDPIIVELRNRLPGMAHSEIRGAISRLVTDIETEPRVMEILESLADVQVKLSGDRTITFGEIVKAKYVPPKPTPAAKSSPRSQLADRTQCEDLLRRFGAAVVAEDFAAVQKILCGPLRKKFTSKKLKELIANNTKHSGPPDAFDSSIGDSTIAELREGQGEFPPLPTYVTAGNFRHWCCLEFLPAEDSDVDSCFDLWMALIDEKGELRVGYFHILDPD